MAWQRRSDPKSGIANWKRFGSSIGWQRNEQSSSDPRTYQSASRDDLIELMRAKGEKHWTLFLCDILMSLKFLAKPPEEKELSSDLYVLF